MILEKTDILLLDEPTNHLDMKRHEWLKIPDKIQRGRADHLRDRYFLDRVVNRIVEIVGGKAGFTGATTAFMWPRRRHAIREQLKRYEWEQRRQCGLRRLPKGSTSGERQ
jgi:ATPase subunit of ABC transporter with duplicated ATPase domains